MKRLLRSRRAVSPVIAAVLMIMITVVGMSVLFAFFVNYARDFQLGRGSAVLESLVIENVWVHEDSDTVDIWVYNVGKVDFTITDVYINDFHVVETGLQVKVDVGEHGNFTVTSASSLNVAVPPLVKVVTARGSAVEGRY